MYYGKELIIDLKDCDASKFTREHITEYFVELCDLIGMERGDLHFWDDEGVSEEEKQTDLHTKGTSAVQFILTSNITIHTLDLVSEVYVNIFSCKFFAERAAATFTRHFFGGDFQTNTNGAEWRVFTRGWESRV